MGRYSSSKKKSRQETSKKDKIRNNAEYIGLLENTTIADEKTHKAEKKEKIIVFESIHK
jgi:hypothetical protein